MEITEKVAYLKGLVEGMGLDTTKKEGKLFATILDVLEDLALELADVQAAQDELGEGLDAISDDLEDVEDVVFGDEDDEEDSEEDEDEEEEGEGLDDEDCYATTCPNCEESIYFDEDILKDGKIICPNCGEQLVFDHDEDGEPLYYSDEITCPSCGLTYKITPTGGSVCPNCGYSVDRIEDDDGEDGSEEEDLDDLNDLPF